MTQLLNVLSFKDKVSGYQITEKIYSGSKTIVYRGIREHDRQAVILKIMATEYPTFGEIAQFRNQYTIAKSLDVPGIVKPLGIENYRNGYALVMEDFGGISLADWQLYNRKNENGSISLNQFFPIALQIVSILEGLHCHRVIHKDIKPANILINSSTGEVKLIDFSLATLLPREIQFLTNPNVLEGTLAYISPEQTGRMNRGIDYRSDFYSLGVTFFELLTGQLPFTVTDPIELVYSHIAKQPLRASDIHANIPPILSDIIAKLMAKNAEDRYQSTRGLKYDLEICHNQWQDEKNIGAFQLGTRDVSDRFLIPEKLYGREQEVETLIAAFERVTNPPQGHRGVEMILVAGSSGIGKTAVVNEVHKPIARQRSYFIKGKFDQFQRDIPLFGIVQAFRDLIGQLLSETDTQIQHWKANILSALGDQAQVIVDIIPELEQIIGIQPEASTLSGTASQNRFNLLFQRFIQVFTTKEHPLVIFLDDLQWADTASLKLIELLMSQSNVGHKNLSLSAAEITENEDTGGLLLIGAYRDNEVSQAHPLYLTIQEIEKLGVTIHNITLKPLNKTEVNSLIADTLRCKAALALPLTQIVFAKTNGNPFFATQLLTSLYQDGILKFNFDAGFWQYDIAAIQTMTFTDDVADFMAIQLKKLPEPTQEVLMLAACIGNEFDLQTLASVSEKSVVDTASYIWTALQEGLLISQTKTCTLFQCDSLQEGYQTDSQDAKKLSPIVSQESPEDSFSSRDSSVRNLQIPKYKFIHDRVQQAAYSLIPEDQKKAIHLKIGLLLLKNIPVVEQEDNIFQIVNQFNIAVELITEEKKCDDLAQMNLTAGRKALASTAYTTALKYLTTGIELLTNDSWDKTYNLSLTLFETAAEAAFLAGEFEQMGKFVDVVLKQAQTVLEQVKVYEVKLKALGAQNKTLEALNTALGFLKLLDVEFSEHPTERDFELAMAETASNLKGRSIEELINLPEMTDAKSLAIMCILSITSNFTYQVAPQLFPLSCLKQINLSIQYGNSPFSCYAYVTYGLMLAGTMGDIQSGYEFGKLGENLLAKFNVKEVKTRIIVSFNSVIRHWKEHANCVLKPLLEAYHNGIETGDLEYSAYSLNTYTYCSYFLGRELTVLAKEIQAYSYAIAEIRQEKVFYWNSIYCQNILNLWENVENPCCLIGQFYDEEKMLPIHQHANDVMGLIHLYCSKLNLCYLFNEFYQAVENASLAEKYLDGGLGQIVIPVFHFYDSLAQLAVYPQLNEYEQNQILHKVEINQQKMQHWANHAPMNHLHKYYLVEAERYKVLGQFFDAMELYDRAICLARENEYINEEALANEVAARFYLDLRKDKIAQMYLIDAYYAYSRWGAKAKAKDLVKRYPQLLAPVLEQEQPNTHPTHQTTSSTKSLSSLSSHQTVIGLKTSISDSLDLAAVIKASQALSGEIELEQLLSTLIKIVMENAGASKCALILSKVNNSNLTVTAISTSSTIEFPSTCLESSRDIPITLVNYVKRTLEILLVDDVKADTSIADDSYIIREQPKSILCIPIINQAKLIGIIYLENKLTTGAFTRDRLEVLQLLTTQAAISLENAILYKNLADANQKLMEYNHTLEELVETRTQELIDKNHSLQQTLQDLKRTQSQLIQSEKMSSLGQMIAGIAHEINNPINFIHGNIQHTNQYIQDLLDLIDIYQQECSNPSPVVEEKIEEIDLDFILKDLPKMLDSMKVGTSRIRNIVLSLRNFSRLDEAEMKFIDIHEGIDNTLMILQHRLKKQSERVEITVIKEYGQLPEINCYAGQLNQVFMNILSNAIDALEEELRKGRTKAPIIRICTEVINNTVQIKIADNGCGIPEAVKQKIFDPFFTTKPIGSGTGLGLSISYQVIVDKHQGQLICNSTPGEGTEFIVEIPMQI